MNPQPFSTGMISEKQFRIVAADSVHCSSQPPLKLVVVIGIQQVVFPVVLVVQHNLNVLKSLFESHPVVMGFRIGVIAPGAPGQISLSKLITPFPLT